MSDPDYIYDPDDWESTYDWADCDCLVDDAFSAPWAPESGIKRFCTLIKGPDKFCTEVPVAWGDDGEVDETEFQWFDSEAEAQAARGVK